LEQLKEEGEELDILDEFSLWVYQKATQFYNPIEKMAKRHEQINNLADDISEKLFGVKSSFGGHKEQLQHRDSGHALRP
jgi:hypothetical protein